MKIIKENNNHIILAITEIIAIILIYYIVAWQLIHYILEHKLWQIILIWFLGLIFIYYLLFISSKLHNETLEEKGLGKATSFFIRIDNFKSSAPIYLFITFLIFIILIIMTYIKYNSFEFEVNYYSIFLKLFFYFISATIQALIFFSFLLLRIQYVVYYFSLPYKKMITVVIFSLLFSLSHYPNFKLIILTFFFAVLLGYTFIKKRNLFWIIIIHTIMGTYLHRIYQMHMKIGILYGTEESFFRKTIPGVENLIGNLW